MIDRVAYFRQALRDIQHINREFVRAQNEARALYPNAIREKDARITVFAKCINTILSAEFGLGFYLSQMLDQRRFAQIIRAEEPLTREQTITIQDQFQQFIKMAMINFFYASLDSSFRTFVKVADPKFTVSDENFRNLYEHTLKKLRLNKKYKPALDMLRLCRNTQHTNGYHNAENETVYFHGKHYRFVRGEMQDFFEWPFLIIIMYDIRQMLLEMIKTKRIGSVQHIEDPFTTPPAVQSVHYLN
jgi:hypothetical protein